MLTGARKFTFCVLGAAAVLGWLGGCERLDDDDLSGGGGKFVAQSVTPNSLQSDVTTDTDPNTMAMSPPEDDVVTVSVRNDASTDIIVNTVFIQCVNGTLDVPGAPFTSIVGTGLTAALQVTIADGAYKEANSAALLAIGSDACQIRFRGEDLTGDPVASNEVAVNITFIDGP